MRLTGHLVETTPSLFSLAIAVREHIVESQPPMTRLAIAETLTGTAASRNMAEAGQDDRVVP